MSVTPSFDVDGFQTNLSYPGQPSAQCPNKRCCGCFKHIYDHFEGNAPWPCYWNQKLTSDSSGSTIVKDKTNWVVEDSKLKMYTIVPNPSFPTIRRSDTLWFKLRPIEPPWTIQFIYKIKMMPFNAFGFAGNPVYSVRSDIRVREGSPALNLYRGGGPDQYHKFIMDINMGTISPNIFRAYTVDDYPNQEYEIYQRLSFSTSREITVDFKIDGNTPDLEPTDGLGNPYIDTLPFTVTMTNLTSHNRWFSTKCYTLNIRPGQGDGTSEIDYLEAQIVPGII